MILYYAAGGGLGHLTRARAIIYTLGLEEQVAILTASSFASDKRVVGETKLINIPQKFSSDLEGYRAWLCEVFAESRPTEIFLDTFPCGILGEFCDFDFPKNVAIYHVARSLRWIEYGKLIRGSTPVFKAAYVVEPLLKVQERYLKTCSEKMIFLELTDPPPGIGEAEQDFIQRFRESLRLELRPCWLVIHSGSLEEICELLAYANEMSEQERANPRIILITSGNVELTALQATSGLQTLDSRLQTALEHYDFYPATILFPFAERIITACGFNIMRQTENYKNKHRFLPFVRRFDDQFLRAAKRRASK
jgi:hypothetical protein